MTINRLYDWSGKIMGEANLATKLAKIRDKHNEKPRYDDKDTWSDFMLNTYTDLVYGAEHNAQNGETSFSLVIQYSSSMGHEFDMIIKYLKIIDGFKIISRNFMTLQEKGVYSSAVYQECVILEW